MKIHLLSGFLGSGKTTAIQQAVKLLLQQGVPTGVVANDQGSKLVDGRLFDSLNIPNRQVINGCFCCNYHELSDSLASLVATNGTDVVFAEAVGSCTDLVASVAKPLLQFWPGAQVTVSVFADVRLLQMLLTEGRSSFDEDVRYIYLKQLEEAGIIVVNKIDLIDEATLADVSNIMQKKYSNKIVLYQDSHDESNIAHWLHTLASYSPATRLPSLSINYDIYAEGEAKLAWVDQVFEIFSLNYHALQCTEKLINSIYFDIRAAGFPIGHLKFLVNDHEKISFTSEASPPVALHITPAPTATILMNMRVQAPPDLLTQLVQNAINTAESEPGTRIVVSSQSAFQPAYPKPAFRM